MLSSSQGLAKVVVGAGGGIAFVATAGVSVDVCPCVTPTSRARSIETARSSCVWALTTAVGFGTTGGDMERRLGLSCFQGSVVVVVELQLKAIGVSADTGGRLCLAGAASITRGVGTDVFVRKCPLGFIGSGGAGVSQ